MVPPDYRAGDVLRVSCPFTPAQITEVSRFHVTVQWPWWADDPDGGIPVGIDPLLRPHGFLEIGDEIADAAARAWRFDGPWDRHPGADARRPRSIPDSRMTMGP
ncbi:hypothetical protein ACQEU3_45435 [Spirillospora sp. CA-253888]